LVPREAIAPGVTHFQCRGRTIQASSLPSQFHFSQQFRTNARAAAAFLLATILCPLLARRASAFFITAFRACALSIIAGRDFCVLKRTTQTNMREIFFRVASPKRLAHVGSILLVGAGFRNDGVLAYHDFAFPAIMRLRSSPIRSSVQSPALESNQRYSLFAPAFTRLQACIRLR